MITPITKNIWQLCFTEFGSCVYLLKLNGENILIDTGSKSNKEELLEYLNELKIKPEQIDKIILTHKHWDHIENIKLFEKAKIYASKKDFSKPRDKNIIDINKLDINEIKIIDTPGHTIGGICLYLPKEKILFSGDTLFHKGIGRTDLFTGSPKDMKKSLEELKKIDYKILCPGHI